MKPADLWPKVRWDVWMAALLAILVWAWIDAKSGIEQLKELFDPRSGFRWQTTNTLEQLHRQLEDIRSRLTSAEKHLGDR